MDIHQKCLDECAEKIEKDYSDGIKEYKTELRESYKLLSLQQFLEEMGLDARFRNDGKLYLTHPEGKESEILKKCDELGIAFNMEQQRMWEPIGLNPQKIEGFSKVCWFEVVE